MAGTPTPGRRPPNRGIVLGFVLGAAVVLLVGAVTWSRIGPSGMTTALFTPNPNLSTQERRGQEIYVANCASCHGGASGGSMMDYPPRHNADGHTWHHPDCQLKQIIREGRDEMTDMMRQMMAPPSAPTMQPFKDRLSDDEIDAVLAFIKTMWTPAQREAQSAVTKDACRAV